MKLNIATENLNAKICCGSFFTTKFNYWQRDEDNLEGIFTFPFFKIDFLNKRKNIMGNKYIHV